MSRKIAIALFLLSLSAVPVSALDVGAHLGYFGNDVKKAYVGVDAMFPIGMFAIAPNIDYTKASGAGLWWGNADLDLRFNKGMGRTFWVGAGPTYYYVTNYHEESGSTTTGPYGHGSVFSAASTDESTIREWGWDVNGGFELGGTFRPYFTARYNKIKEYKAGGVAVGIRFGH